MGSIQEENTERRRALEVVPAQLGWQPSGWSSLENAKKFADAPTYIPIGKRPLGAEHVDLFYPPVNRGDGTMIQYGVTIETPRPGNSIVEDTKPSKSATNGAEKLQARVMMVVTQVGKPDDIVKIEPLQPSAIRRCVFFGRGYKMSGRASRGCRQWLRRRTDSHCQLISSDGPTLPARMYSNPLLTHSKKTVSVMLTDKKEKEVYMDMCGNKNHSSIVIKKKSSEVQDNGKPEHPVPTLMSSDLSRNGDHPVTVPKMTFSTIPKKNELQPALTSSTQNGNLDKPDKLNLENSENATVDLLPVSVNIKSNANGGNKTKNLSAMNPPTSSRITSSKPTQKGAVTVQDVREPLKTGNVSSAQIAQTACTPVSPSTKQRSDSSKMSESTDRGQRLKSGKKNKSTNNSSKELVASQKKKVPVSIQEQKSKKNSLPAKKFISGVSEHVNQSSKQSCDEPTATDTTTTETKIKSATTAIDSSKTTVQDVVEIPHKKEKMTYAEMAEKTCVGHQPTEQQVDSPKTSESTDKTMIPHSESGKKKKTTNNSSKDQMASSKKEDPALIQKKDLNENSVSTRKFIAGIPKQEGKEHKADVANSSENVCNESPTTFSAKNRKKKSKKSSLSTVSATPTDEQEVQTTRKSINQNGSKDDPDTSKRSSESSPGENQEAIVPEGMPSNQSGFENLLDTVPDKNVSEVSDNEKVEGLLAFSNTVDEINPGEIKSDCSPTMRKIKIPVYRARHTSTSMTTSEPNHKADQIVLDVKASPKTEPLSNAEVAQKSCTSVHPSTEKLANSPKTSESSGKPESKEHVLSTVDISDKDADHLEHSLEQSRVKPNTTDTAAKETKIISVSTEGNSKKQESPRQKVDNGGSPEKTSKESTTSSQSRKRKLQKSILSTGNTCAGVSDNLSPNQSNVSTPAASSSPQTEQASSSSSLTPVQIPTLQQLLLNFANHHSSQTQEKQEALMEVLKRYCDKLHFSRHSYLCWPNAGFPDVTSFEKSILRFFNRDFVFHKSPVSDELPQFKIQRRLHYASRLNPKIQINLAGFYAVLESYHHEILDMDLMYLHSFRTNEAQLEIVEQMYFKHVLETVFTRGRPTESLYPIESLEGQLSRRVTEPQKRELLKYVQLQTLFRHLERIEKEKIDISPLEKQIFDFWMYCTTTDNRPVMWTKKATRNFFAQQSGICALCQLKDELRNELKMSPAQALAYGYAYDYLASMSSYILDFDAWYLANLMAEKQKNLLVDYIELLFGRTT